MKLIAPLLGLLFLFSPETVHAFQTKPAPSPTPNVKKLDYYDLIEKLEQLDYAPDNSVKVTVKTHDKKKAKAGSVANATLQIESSGKSGGKSVLKIDLNEIEVPTKGEINSLISVLKARPRYSPPTPKCGSLPSPQISPVGLNGDFMLMVDYTYTRPGYSITVPREFVYDRASIPPFLWPAVTKDNVGDVAPLIHDYLYKNGGRLPSGQVSPHRTFSREDADALFHEIMIKCGVKKWRSDGAWAAVRNFAGYAWQGTAGGGPRPLN